MMRPDDPTARCDEPAHHPDVRRIPSLGSRGEGWFVLQLAAIVAVTIAPALAPPASLDDARLVSLGLVIGDAAVVGGLALIVWGATVLSRVGAFSVFPRPLGEGTLVMNGPFRFVRHPIYSGLILAGLGTALGQRSPLTLLATAALFVVLDLKRRREEAWLLDRYPDYADYSGRTRALIPAIY